MQTVAIVGVGLIGGSFGLALRKYGWKGRILGVSSARTLEEAIRLGAIDQAATLEEAAAEADVLYLAQPVTAILDTLDRLPAIIRPGCLVTDAGSTKAEIVKRARSLAGTAQFLGGHPLAGKESRGVASADPDLFVGRTYVLTPIMEAELLTPLAGGFANLLTTVGAIPVVLPAEEHDRVIAFTSHLPQLASTALSSLISQQLTDKSQIRVSGPGLLGATRLALSPWDVWRDIVATNTANIDHALGVYIDKLTEMRENLQTHRLADEFAIASEAAGEIRRLGATKPLQRGERPCE